MYHPEVTLLKASRRYLKVGPISIIACELQNYSAKLHGEILNKKSSQTACLHISGSKKAAMSVKGVVGHLTQFGISCRIWYTMKI